MTLDMLDEPQRHDSAFHPLLEARRAVLQDLAEHPVPTSPAYSQTGRPDKSADAGQLAVASPPDSALHTLSAARATVGNELHGQRAAAYPPDFDASPRSRTSPRLSSEVSAAGGLFSQTSLNSGFGPPQIDNPSQTLEEARRLMLGQGSSSHAHAGSSQPGLVRTTSKTLEEARRLMLGPQEGSSSERQSGFSHSGPSLHDDFGLQRDSAQHPLLEARQAVLEDLGRPSS